METDEVKKGAGYFSELSIRFAREHIEAASAQADRLPVLLGGREIGIVTPGGAMRIRKKWLGESEASELYHRAGAIAAEVREYMTLMEAAAPLKAQSLNEPYKLLADFNGAVLGGMDSRYGVQFTTWEWTYNKTGLTHGHYCGNHYAAAKEDFAVRAGLVDERRLFTPDELTAMYRSTAEIRNGVSVQFTYEQERELERLQERIESIVPDLREKLTLAENRVQTMQQSM